MYLTFLFKTASHPSMAKSTCRGILSREHDHWMQLQWTGFFISAKNDTGSWIQSLDKTDIEGHGSGDQIIIRRGCPLTRAPERCYGVCINLQVKTLIVHKYGFEGPFCYFKNQGQNAYAGQDLETDPFHE